MTEQVETLEDLRRTTRDKRRKRSLTRRHLIYLGSKWGHAL